MSAQEEYIHCSEPELEAPVLDAAGCDHIYDHLLGLVEQLYQTGDVDRIGYHVEEMLYAFGERMPEKEINIIRKPTQEEKYKDKFYTAYVGYTRAYAQMMTTSKLRK